MSDALVLDTCAVLWLAAGDRRLSARAVEAIDRAAVVWVSAISAWEIDLKARRGQLELPLSSREWFMRALDAHDLRMATLTLDVLFGANALPWHHRDPADRFIIATAQREHCPVVTTDRHFERYGIPVIG